MIHYFAYYCHKSKEVHLPILLAIFALLIMDLLVLGLIDLDIFPALIGAMVGVIIVAFKDVLEIIRKRKNGSSQSNRTESEVQSS